MRQKIRKQIGDWYQNIRSEQGSMAIVEAAYVFPIMFFVIFFLIYFGNMYYVKASVDSIVSCEAIKGAQYYANPWVKTVNEELGKTKVPEKNMDVQPYRQFFSDRTIQGQIQQETEEKIRKLGGGAFAGMNPKVSSCKAKYNNRILYADFGVEADYKITFPIRFLGTKESTSISFSASEVVNVTDNTEFVRNTDMVIDYYQRSKLKDKIDGLKQKVNNFISKFH